MRPPTLSTLVAKSASPAPNLINLMNDALSQCASSARCKDSAAMQAGATEDRLIRLDAWRDDRAVLAPNLINLTNDALSQCASSARCKDSAAMQAGATKDKLIRLGPWRDDRATKVDKVLGVLASIFCATTKMFVRKTCNYLYRKPDKNSFKTGSSWLHALHDVLSRKQRPI